MTRNKKSEFALAFTKKEIALIYKNIRELAMSYLHEYFLDNGQKTLRQYSALLNLNNLCQRASLTNKDSWAISQKNLWHIDKKLDKTKHYDILPKAYLQKLRRADEVEIKAGKIVAEHKN